MCQYSLPGMTVASYLAENSADFAYSTKDKTKGKLSHTGYQVLKQTGVFALLELDLLTGRKHQIRVHLADIGHPVVGDQKYGNGDRYHLRLALHAKSICFTHRFSGERLTLEAKVPRYFTQLIGNFVTAASRGSQGVWRDLVSALTEVSSSRRPTASITIDW